MKRIVIFIISFLLSLSVSHIGVQAAEQEEVILSAVDGKAAIDVRLSGQSEGISTLRLTVKIEDGMEKLDAENPVVFEADGGIEYRLLETKDRTEDGYVTIYLSHTSDLTEQTEFRLGYLIPNTTDNTAFELTLSVPENGLAYVDGNGQLWDERSIASAAVSIQVNAAGQDTPEETPGDTSEETPGDTPEVMPGDEAGTVSEESGESSGNGQNPDKSQMLSPVQTGDNSSVLLYGILTGLSAVCLGTVYTIRKRKKQ